MARGSRDRLARCGRRHPSLQLRRGRGAGEACGDARSTRSASRKATAWRRSPGTVFATSSSTTASPPRDACCTRSTRGSFPEQLHYIIHHAEDAYVFFDPVFAPLVEALAPRPAERAGLGVAQRSRRDACRSRSTNFSSTKTSSRRLRPITSGRSSTRTAASNALLHLRHDRQPEGRALQPSLDRAARLRRLRGRRLGALGARFAFWSWCRSSTPTPGAFRSRGRCAA